MLVTGSVPDISSANRRHWHVGLAVLSAACVLGETILASRLLNAGVMRSPSAGSASSGESLRTVIQPVPQRRVGKTKLPTYVAPGASNTTSPGCARLSAL